MNFTKLHRISIMLCEFGFLFVSLNLKTLVLEQRCSNCSSGRYPFIPKMSNTCMQHLAKADASASSEYAESILSKLSIGKNSIPNTPKLVRSYTEEFRGEMKKEVLDKVGKAQTKLVSELNATIMLREKPGMREGNTDGQSIEEKITPWAFRLAENAPAAPSIPLEGYSGIDGNGAVQVWYDYESIPKNATVLFFARKKGEAWEVKPAPNPDISAPYLSALRQADKTCAVIEQRALEASAVLSQLEPKKGFLLDGLEEAKRIKIEALSGGERLGSLPVIFINYANGDTLPMEFYVSKVSKDYCIVDPLTGIHAEGGTLVKALEKLSQSGYYPPGVIFLQSASNGFVSSFEKAGVIGASTVVKSWEGKVDTIAGAIGWFSLGCAIAAPETGGLSLAGTATGAPAMGWFSFRAVQHFIKKYKYEKEFFDPASPDDWREAGMLLTSVLTKGKGARIMRTAGLGMMASADVWQFHDDFSKMKDDPEKMSSFLIKRSGQLAASLAMALYFSKRELGGLKAIKVKPSFKASPELSVEQLDQILKTPASSKSEITVALLELGARNTPDAIKTLNRVAELRTLGAASPYEHLPPGVLEMAKKLVASCAPIVDEKIVARPSAPAPELANTEMQFSMLAKKAEATGNSELALAISKRDFDALKMMQLAGEQANIKNNAMGLIKEINRTQTGQKTKAQQIEENTIKRSKATTLVSTETIKGKELFRFKVTAESGEREFMLLDPSIADEQAFALFGGDFVAIDYASRASQTFDHHLSAEFDPTLPTATTMALEGVSRGIDTLGKKIAINHVDTDSMLGAFSVMNPELALKHRRLLEEASRCADYIISASPEAREMTMILNYVVHGPGKANQKVATATDLIPELLGVYGEGKTPSRRINELSARAQDFYRKGWDVGQRAQVKDGIVTIQERNRDYSRTGACEASFQKAMENGQDVHAIVIISPRAGADGNTITISKHPSLTEKLSKGGSSPFAEIPSQNLLNSLNLLEMQKLNLSGEWETLEFLASGKTWGGRPGSGIGSPRVDNGTLLDPNTILDALARDADGKLPKLRDYKFPLARRLAEDRRLLNIVSEPDNINGRITRDALLNNLKAIYDERGDKALLDLLADPEVLTTFIRDFGGR